VPLAAEYQLNVEPRNSPDRPAAFVPRDRKRPENNRAENSLADGQRNEVAVPEGARTGSRSH
jgi:hypothetical protein